MSDICNYILFIALILPGIINLVILGIMYRLTLAGYVTYCCNEELDAKSMIILLVFTLLPVLSLPGLIGICVILCEDFTLNVKFSLK